MADWGTWQKGAQQNIKVKLQESWPTRAPLAEKT